MKKGIIFDLDGTLWDTSVQIIPAWNKVLKKHNLAQITDKDMQGFMGKTLENIASCLFPDFPMEKGMAILEECCNQEQKYLSIHGGTLYPDLVTTLKKLSQYYKLYIVSNCRSEYLNSFFTAHGLRDFFEDYETNGNTGLPKSDNIKLIIKRNKLDKAVYVGDTQIDCESASSANIAFIYASYGFGRKVNAQYVINRFSELPECIKQVF